MVKVKGILLTLGAFLLVMPLITLSIIIHNTYVESEEKIIELGKIERINELDKSIQDGFKVVLNEKWGVNASANQATSTIKFNEDLTNPAQRNIGELPSTTFADYANFVEGKYNASPKINISDYVLTKIYGNLVIFVKPQMAVYKHDKTNKEVTFTLEKEDHIAKCGDPCLTNGYKINLVVDEAKPTGSFIEAPKTCTGANCLRVEIEVKNTLGQLLGTDYMSVSPDFSSTAKVNFDKKSDAVEVKISNHAKLTLKEVNTNTNVRIFSIAVTFSNIDYPYSALSATLQENLVNIYLEDLGTVKTSTAAIT